jgi:hypothetical protein
MAHHCGQLDTCHGDVAQERVEFNLAVSLGVLLTNLDEAAEGSEKIPRATESLYV